MNLRHSGGNHMYGWILVIDHGEVKSVAEADSPEHLREMFAQECRNYGLSATFPVAADGQCFCILAQHCD